jgi:hypothetical protein
MKQQYLGKKKLIYNFQLYKKIIIIPKYFLFIYLPTYHIYFNYLVTYIS